MIPIIHSQGSPFLPRTSTVEFVPRHRHSVPRDFIKIILHSSVLTLKNSGINVSKLFKITPRSRRDFSVFKSTWCSFRGSRYKSKHSWWLTTIYNCSPRALTHCSGLSEYIAPMCCRDTHASKAFIYIK